MKKIDNFIICNNLYNANEILNKKINEIVYMDNQLKLEIKLNLDKSNDSINNFIFTNLDLNDIEKNNRSIYFNEKYLLTILEMLSVGLINNSTITIISDNHKNLLENYELINSYNDINLRRINLVFNGFYNNEFKHLKFASKRIITGDYIDNEYFQTIFSKDVSLKGINYIRSSNYFEYDVRDVRFEILPINTLLELIDFDNDDTKFHDKYPKLLDEYENKYRNKRDGIRKEEDYLVKHSSGFSF